MLEFRESDKDLISATHVCSIWRSALTSAPSLWTEIVFQDPDRALAYLTRSGALPIDVSFGTCNFDPEDFYTSRISWLDRVQSMDVRGNEEEIDTTLRRLCLPAPILRSLKLSGKSQRTWIPRDPGPLRFPREFFDDQAPTLQDLSLFLISPALAAKLPLTNLTSLTWINEFSEFSVGDLLSVLESAPLLELLTLDLRFPSVLPGERSKIVNLKNLRELTYSNPGGLFSPTSYLVAPELRRLSLCLVSRTTEEADLGSIFSPLKGSFPLLDWPTEIKYTIKYGTQLCVFRSPTTYISTTVHCGYDNEAHAPRFLRSAAVALKRLKKMTIEVNRYSIREFPTELFESLETLELVCGLKNNFPFIRPRSCEPSDVPFPALLEVRITPGGFTPSLAGLAEILMERKLAGRGVKTVRIREGYHKTTDEDVARIRESVGEFVLRSEDDIDY